MRKLFLVLLLNFCNLFFSQKNELGEVTIDELKQKRHELDTTAPAAILFKKGKIEFNYRYGLGFTTITEVQVKLKIYKKEGLDYANQAIRYYIDGNSKETVSILSAYTYNLVEGKVSKTKLKSEGEFDEKINKYWARKKISFPNVKEGSIVEFKYRLLSPNYGKLKDWSFQESIPVNYSEYYTYIPEYFTYNTYFKGALFPFVEKDWKENAFEGTYQEMVNQHGGFRSERGTYEVKYKELVNKYVLKNIPSIKDEKFVDNIENYYAALQLELSSIKMPNQQFENYSTDWETVCSRIYEMSDFGQELNKTGYFEDDLKTILKGATEKNHKIALIFNYVKSKVKWNGFHDYYCHDGVKTAYKNGTGNVAEINLMLVAMLRYAGVDTNPILVSTRGNGISLFPSRTAFDYVIAGVEMENDIILLDATEKYGLPNILPERAINWNGRIIRKNGSSANVSLNPDFISKETTNMLLSFNPEGKIEGKIRIQKNDYTAYQFRDSYNSLTEDSYLEKFEKKLNDSQVTDYKIENKLELGKPIVETFSFENSNEIEKIGDKIYINPLLFYSLNENPFKQDKREYPVDFTFPEQDKYQVIVTLPEGYLVESIPTPVNLVFSDKSLGFLFNISNSGKQIQIISQLDINTSIVSQDNYEELKAFFNEVVKKQTEKIVLRKV